MKLKIDTIEKTIQIEQECTLERLVAIAKKMFPDNEWKKYKIQAVQYIYGWSNPIYIPSVWYEPTVVPYTLTAGESETFCIETN